MKQLDATQENLKVFSRRLVQLSLPIMLQFLLISSVSFIDTLMIGRIGKEALAAVGLANQVFFLISLFFFGVTSGSAIFIAQYWGSQELDSLHKAIGLALIFTLIGALFSSIISLFAPQAIMRIFTNDVVVVAKGSEYLVYVGISYLFTAVVMTISAALRSTGNTTTPLIVSIIANLTNIILNSFLIYGLWIFPRMEVAGAALATTVARFVEMVLLIAFIYGKKLPIAASPRALLAFDRPFVIKFLITCAPVILNEIFWSLGVSTYKIAFARMGIDVVAAVNVSESIQNLFFVALRGMGSATAIMIGNRIGENKLDVARLYAYRSLIIGFVLGLAIGLILIASANFLPVPFGLDPEVYLMSVYALRTLGALMGFKAVNLISIVGILRAGGDTRFSMIVEMGSVWLIGVPMAFVGGLALHLPLYAVYLLIAIEEIFKFATSINRIRGGTWIHRFSTIETTLTNEASLA